MKSKELVRVEHVWVEDCDRWIYIEEYEDGSIGLNYCQGDDYDFFKHKFCEVDKGLSEFYEAMHRDFKVERMSVTRTEFISKTMWAYHHAICLSEQHAYITSKQ